MDMLLFRSLLCQVISSAHRALSDDERVVALDPAVRGEDEEIEPDSEQQCSSAAQLKCSLDELVVGRDPAVGGEDHELEAGAKHLAIR
jgi:hypothetical protein